MPIISVIVNGIYYTHALLDTCSSDTFCSKDLAYSIGGQGSTTTYTPNTLNATEDVTSEIVQFSLSSEYNTETFNMNNVRVIKQIPTRGISCDISHYPHLRGITCPGDVRVDILIGQDNPAILRPIDVRTGKHNKLFAVRGVLGWTLNGPVHSQRPGKCVMNNLVSFIQKDMLSDFNLGMFKYYTLFLMFRFTVNLRLRVSHMTVVSAQLVSLNYAYWLSVGWGVLS